jgi:hypothetical protein
MKQFKWELKIALATGPDNTYHIKYFDNIFDCIDYMEEILNGNIEDDWDCHIESYQEHQHLKTLTDEQIKQAIKPRTENSYYSSFENFKELIKRNEKKYNKKEFLNQMISDFVTKVSSYDNTRKS